MKIVLSSQSTIKTLFANTDNPIRKAVCGAIEAALLNYPANTGDSEPTDDPVIIKVSIGARMVQIDEGWREELLEIARGKTVFNQGIATHSKPPPEVWNNLYFRSKSEVRIAEALERAGVLFLPNCRARLTNTEGNRENREPDFLICHQGRWGILEVDGEPFHPPSRTVDDHERDRLFKRYSIRTVEHYDSKRCYNNPDQVVREFLEILGRSS